MTLNPKTLWVAAFLWILLASGITYADIWDMASRFQVYISAQEEYSDNIFPAARTQGNNKMKDFITTLSPGIKFSSLPRTPEAGGEFRQAPGPGEPNAGLTGDYHPGFVFYDKNRHLNYTSHNGTLNAWYTWDRRLTFRVRDYLIRSQEPREQDYSQTATAGQYLLGTQRYRRTYLRNVFEPSMDYKFGKENLLLVSYRSNVYRNDDPSVQDSREDYFSPRVSCWFDVRNAVSLEYGLTIGQFKGPPDFVTYVFPDGAQGSVERSPDFAGHMMKGRYIYRFDPKTSFFGEYAFSFRNFDTPVLRLPVPIFPRPETPSRDYVVHNPTVGIEHVFSRTVSGKAQMGYYWQVPDQGARMSGPFYNISIAKREERTTLTLSFQGGYTEDFFTAENLGFTRSYRAIGTITHRLAEKMTVGLTGSFDRTISGPGGTISGPERKENFWEVNGNASYQVFRWLSLSLSASHRENRSNTPDRADASNRDYKENRGVFRVTATY